MSNLYRNGYECSECGHTWTSICNEPTNKQPCWECSTSQEEQPKTTRKLMLHEMHDAYEEDYRVPSDSFLRISTLVGKIVEQLDGREWDDETLDNIAGFLRDEGYNLRDVNFDEDEEQEPRNATNYPEGTTHVHPPSVTYWKLEPLTKWRQRAWFWHTTYNGSGWQESLVTPANLNELEELQP